jgi:hypothetical protein
MNGRLGGNTTPEAAQLEYEQCWAEAVKANGCDYQAGEEATKGTI